MNIRWISLWFLTAIILSGCATTAGILGIGKVDKEKELSRCDDDSDKRPLTKWSAISGILIEKKRGGAEVAAVQNQRYRLISPVSVAARSNDVYIVDAPQNTIIKYDRATQTLRRFINSSGIDMNSDLHIDLALSLYLTDTRNARVEQYDIDGRLVQTFQNASELPQPGAVVVDDSRGEIFIADRLTARVLVFNRGGTIVRVIGADVKENALRFQNIVALAMSTNQLYVVDQLGKYVYALAPSGKVRYKFGYDELKKPGAIATDSYNRVYVADLADNTIKVYIGGEYQTTIGEPRDPARLYFQLISDLWIDNGFMYVADSARASVEILRIVPPCL